MAVTIRRMVQGYREKNCPALGFGYHRSALRARMDRHMHTSGKLFPFALTAALMGSMLAFSGAAPANAAGKVTFAVDAPSVQGSFVAGGVLETFDDSCGNPIAFGSVSGACASFYGNFYSGASTTDSVPTTGGTASNMAVVPMGGAATFTLDSPARYVGFHWEAGNRYDRVRLFSGDKLLADFSFDTLIDALDATNFQSADGLTTYTVADYYGNPVNGQQTHEPYAYVHIFTSEGVTFDSVEISEDAETPVLKPLKQTLISELSEDASGTMKPKGDSREKPPLA